MEKLFQKISFTSASLVLALLLGIFVTLFLQAKPAIDEFGFNFIVDKRWNQEVPLTQTGNLTQDTTTVVQTPEAAEDDDMIADEDDMILDEDDEDETATKTVYGGLVPILGTIFSTLIALAFALPIAMGIAVFLAEMASKNVAKYVGIAIELLAAIPSIIFGMWGLYYFAPIISDIFGGFQVSLLTAGLVLGVMILPFMAAITRDSMNTTPDVLKESAYALGATKFEVVKDVIFPFSKVGIIGSIILALGRALGETMAVAFLIGAVYSIPEKITDPTISIPVAMALNFGEASGLGENALFYLGLILFILSFAFIAFAKFYFLKRSRV
ncbi:phosphate ABC transporter permease subunit PstC [Sulfurimonas paralvinellae]|uniref:Phosphate transport system permease protein n=1 Tax=Sulfurimonas paralvinellae TaxID=317658 RepID=A0A7M1B9I6_9BACT|nr:phosphate ABC transporter permease subunit PstC [Sulfurimonas paralvinellae]QOP46397.1 phosphate ABC transporter permease subunit PstC [Sulfurimonas paralvinellae]